MGTHASLSLNRCPSAAVTTQRRRNGPPALRWPQARHSIRWLRPNRQSSSRSARTIILSLRSKLSTARPWRADSGLHSRHAARLSASKATSSFTVCASDHSMRWWRARQCSVNVNRRASRRVFKTWATIVKEMRSAGQLKAPPDLFKIESKGTSAAGVLCLCAITVAATANPNGVALQHHEPAWSMGKQHWATTWSTGELGMLAQLWHNAGYRLISRDDNLDA